MKQNPFVFPTAKYVVTKAHEFNINKFFVNVRDSEDSYDKMLKLLSIYFSSDCTAFVVKGDNSINNNTSEIIWDYFEKHDKSYTELIDQNVRRNYLIKEPHMFFRHFLIKNKPVEFTLYMMGDDEDNTNLLIVHGLYDPIDKSFNFSFSSNKNTL